MSIPEPIDSIRLCDCTNLTIGELREVRRHTASHARRRSRRDAAAVRYTVAVLAIID